MLSISVGKITCIVIVTKRSINDGILLQGFSFSVCFGQCCAISFIENLDAQSLSLSQEEYESYMEGRAVPPGSQSSEPVCEGLRMMYANLASLEELRGRQDRLMKDARQLQREMTAWRDSVVKQVSEAGGREGGGKTLTEPELGSTLGR